MISDGGFTHSDRFLSSYKSAKALRIAEYVFVYLVLLSVLVLFLAISLKQFPNFQILTLTLTKISSSKIVLSVTLSLNSGYAVLQGVRFFFYGAFSEVLRSELNAVKASAQAYSDIEVNDEARRLVDNFKRYSNSILGDGRRGVFANLIAALVVGGVYFVVYAREYDDLAFFNVLLK